MRALACVLFLVACDHRAAPKQDQPPVAAPSAAASASALEDACLGVGVKITEVIIASATDPAEKAAYEQERTKLVRKFSEACRGESWPEAARACFMAATTSADVQACSRALAHAQGQAPPPTPSAPPTGVH